MEQLEGWKLLALAMSCGAGAGVLFWLAAWIAGFFVGRIPQRLPFANELPADAGGGDRRRYREAGRELAALFGGLLVALLAAALAWVFARNGSGFPAGSWLLATGAGVALVLAIGAVWRLVVVWLRRRRHRFEWAARAMVGHVLRRLAFTGNRVFHDAVVEGTRIDHVVVGKRGVFAVNVVARRVPKDVDGRAAAELRNGKLWLAGNVEALPVGDAARNMTLLTAALTRVIGHRVMVRSVLAVPGWHTAPNGAGNHLVLNENNLAMLTSWNPPEAFLMEEDCNEVQKFLIESSRMPRLD